MHYSRETNTTPRSPGACSGAGPTSPARFGTASRCIIFSVTSGTKGSMRSICTDVHGLYAAIKRGQICITRRTTTSTAAISCSMRLARGGPASLGRQTTGGRDTSPAWTRTGRSWQYYRKMTERQNAILETKANQNLNSAPTIQYDTSNTTQGPTTVNRTRRHDGHNVGVLRHDLRET
ncbi:hypothetical protein K438DRAFT_1818344 [Mycena galopus ATCC 62051]|nr:hypothetical protein K438DRAFT_1818344 [Mycena galopus ATCC 62051]